MGLGRSRKVILMQRRCESLSVLQTFMGMKRPVLSILSDFIHQILIPLVKGPSCRKLLRQSRNFPVNVTLLSDSVYVFRYKPRIPFGVHLVCLERYQVFGKGISRDKRSNCQIKVVGTAVVYFQSAFYASQKQFQDRFMTILYFLQISVYKSNDSLTHNYNQQGSLITKTIISVFEFKLRMSHQNTVKLNPWTGQKTKPKSDGKFFSLIAQHYPHLDQTGNLQKNYKKLSTLIQCPTQLPSLQEYSDLIDIQSKVRKIRQINEWLQKVEARVSNKQSEQMKSFEQGQMTPIDSSYVYLPLHSGNVFHELLKESTSLYWDGLVHDKTVKRIQRQVEEMQSILKLNNELMKHIIV